jgi:hypothetical protein
MPSPIITNWTGGGPSSTAYAEEQAIQQWIDNAIARAQSNLSNDPPDPAYPIETKWVSGGAPIEVSTPHNPGETTNDWIARHFDRVRAKMADFPPDPT